MSSLEPTGWRITCAAWDCTSSTYSRLSRPLEVKGSKREAIAEARRRGWRPCAEVMDGPSRRNATANWWCPGHVAKHSPPASATG